MIIGYAAGGGALAIGLPLAFWCHAVEKGIVRDFETATMPTLNAAVGQDQAHFSATWRF